MKSRLRSALRLPAWLALACCLLCACEATPGERVTEVRGGDCAVCHRDERAAARTPPHDEARFGDDCGSCHDEVRWAPAPSYAHTAAFPLTLGHEGRSCGACHGAGFAPGATSAACVDCHGSLAAGVIDPVHARLTQDCFACHRTDAFWPARFVHAWPLRGKHALTSCRSCHTDGDTRYEGTSPACFGCHQQDYERINATSAAHKNNATTCDDCHGFETFSL